MVVQLRCRYRAYPDASQRGALARAFGCARVVWNDCLRDRKRAYEAGLPYVTSAQLSRVRITQAKRTEERAFLAEVSAVVLQQSLRDLDRAVYAEDLAVAGLGRTRPAKRCRRDAWDVGASRYGAGTAPRQHRGRKGPPMGTALTAAQRRAVTGSDPATGRLTARADVCAVLAARGLAVPHGRAGHHSYYLTPQGLRLRADLTAARPDVREPGRPVPAGDAFTADDGTGTAPPGGPRRAAEVATAWEGLLRIRALLLDGVTDVPAPWERDRAVHAVALALEAGGAPPASAGGAGYAVTAGGRDGVPEVAWRGAADRESAVRALARCADLLGRYGWQCTEHRTRDGTPFLLASPRRGA